MTRFTTDIVQALLKTEDISEVFRTHLDGAVNTFLQGGFTASLNLVKYDRVGFNSGNSGNGTYSGKLPTKYGGLELSMRVIETVSLTSRQWLRTSAHMIR